MAQGGIAYGLPVDASAFIPGPMQQPAALPNQAVHLQQVRRPLSIQAPPDQDQAALPAPMYQVTAATSPVPTESCRACMTRVHTLSTMFHSAKAAGGAVILRSMQR